MKKEPYVKVSRLIAPVVDTKTSEMKTKSFIIVSLVHGGFRQNELQKLDSKGIKRVVKMFDSYPEKLMKFNPSDEQLIQAVTVSTYLQNFKPQYGDEIVLRADDYYRDKENLGDVIIEDIPQVIKGVLV
ncbi:hypothetical protein [Jeotgalibacillus malaysiensis]|uniref:hypothetical protein n=1 Tax=Jeotgalibacillus malaysiensis TaxID=1508404 RepID=UPI00384D6B47